MTPFETVMQHYKLPPHIQEVFPAQIETVNDLALLPNQGHFLEMGCGKTLCATLISLYYRLQAGYATVVIMPPILITQWSRWLRSINPQPKVLEYRGTPKQREAMSFEGQDFVLVGIQIFKKDYDRFRNFYHERKLVVVVDEATFIANIGTDAHDKVYQFTAGRVRLMLTGTPANKPGDAYGLMKFTAPGTYRNKRHFENVHVADRDYFGNVTKWQSLDLLADNLKKNSKRVLFQDLYPYAETPLFETLEYTLDDEHYKLYRRLSEEELLKLPDGGKIDATTSNRLIHALGQIIVNHDYFSGDPSKGSAAIDLVEQKLSELGDGKLVIFANYRMTISSLVRRFEWAGARAINSEVTAAKKEQNLAAFVDDPKCRLLVIQFVSGGKGLDGLQHVCNHAMFIEPCQQPRDFHQAVARLARTGQTKRVVVWLATALKTLQVRAFRTLLANDDTLNKVVRNAYDLRSVVFGD